MAIKALPFVCLWQCHMLRTFGFWLLKQYWTMVVVLSHTLGSRSSFHFIIMARYHHRCIIIDCVFNALISLLFSYGPRRNALAPFHLREPANYEPPESPICGPAKTRARTSSHNLGSPSRLMIPPIYLLQREREKVRVCTFTPRNRYLLLLRVVAYRSMPKFGQICAHNNMYFEVISGSNNWIS